MKKRFILSIVAVQCLLLVACGASKENPVTITANENVEESNASETEGTEELKAEEESTDKEETVPQKTIFDAKPTIEETTLVDRDGVKIIANSIEYTDTRATLHITIENNTTQDLSFHSATTGYSMNTVNGCVVEEGYLNSDVSAGMKAIEDIYFDKNELVPYGIYDIAEIGMSFYVKDGDNKTLFKTDLATIPTSIYDSIDFSEDTIKKAIDEGVWENELKMNLSYVNTDFVSSIEGLSINAVVIGESQYGSKSIFLELENTSDEEALYGSYNITINGINVSAGRWDSYRIPAHKRGIAQFNLEYLIDEEYRSLISRDSIGGFVFDLVKMDPDSYGEISSSNISIVFDETLAKFELDGEPIYDSNGIKLYLLPVTEDDNNLYYYIPVYVENNHGSRINVGIDDDGLSSAGYMIDCFSFSEYIDDSSNGVIKIEIIQEEAKKYNLNSVEDFESGTCKFVIKDYEHYSDIDKPSIELKFK